MKKRGLILSGWRTFLQRSFPTATSLAFATRIAKGIPESAVTNARFASLHGLRVALSPSTTPVPLLKPRASHERHRQDAA